MTVLLSFSVDKASEQTDVVRYISDALTSWGGAFHPDDPLFSGIQHIEIRPVMKAIKL